MKDIIRFFSSAFQKSRWMGLLLFFAMLGGGQSAYATYYTCISVNGANNIVLQKNGCSATTTTSTYCVNSNLNYPYVGDQFYWNGSFFQNISSSNRQSTDMNGTPPSCPPSCSPPSLSTTTTNANCGASNGKITLYASGGGSGTMYYSINGGGWYPGGSSYTWNNLPAGNHTVWATRNTSNTNCWSNKTVHVGSNSGTALICEFRVNGVGSWNQGNCNPVVCAGQKLELAADPNGLSSYYWTGPNGFAGWGNSDGNILISNAMTSAQAGTYTVTATNSNGCTSTKTINVTVSSVNLLGQFSINGGGYQNGTNVTLCEGGQLYLDVDGASFTSNTWTGPNGSIGSGNSTGIKLISNSVTAADAGTYVVDVVTTDGCVASLTYHVTVTSVNLLGQFSINGGGYQNGTNVTLCEGGQLYLDVDGASFTSNTWTGPNGNIGSGNSTGIKLISNSVTTADAGTYMVDVVTTDGCVASLTYHVTVNPNPVPDAGANVAICEGESTQLSASATGNGPFTFTWDNGLGNGANKTVSPVPSAYANEDFFYTVTVTDGNGCTNTDQVKVTVNSTPDVTNISEVDPTCADNDGSITFTFPDHPNRTNIEFSKDGGATYTTVADNSGSFTFNGLPAGTYDLFVRWGNDECPVDLPDETLTAPSTFVGDLVFNDLDGDGIQDPGEPGVPGVTVNLYTCGPGGMPNAPGTGTPYASDVTDANGNYGFTCVDPGDYYVEIVTTSLPTDFDYTTQDAGGNDGLDSDVDEDGQTACFTVTPNTNNPTIDAGIRESASLGDLVFEDLDRDGQQDAGEPGVPGVTVELYMCGMNTVLETATTDANGNYLFDDLEPNKDYYVIFSNLPTDYVFSDADQGNDATDSDADMNGETDCYFLDPGENELTVDAGINLPTASLGDLVFEDLDRDGQQDAGEPGVPGVTVELYMCGMNTVLETATTDANGNYLFDDLEPNKDYYVIFSNLPADYVFSDADQGNDATDSDADMNGETGCYFLDPGENELTVDAGINLPTASLGDLVFEDLDRDGQQDAGEPGVPGVTVELYMCGMNTVLETATTDANGNYLFDDLEPNKDYYVIFSNLPTDYVFSDADQGNDATDSDADMNGETGCYFLDPGENELTVDAGINLPTASLGDLVFEDLDRDGQQDAGEPGVPGVTVELYMCGMNTVLETATTDANGNYLFDDLEPNKDYYVIFSNLPTDYVFSDADQGNDATDSDADMNGETGCYFLDPGENELTVDAGINLPTASLGDLVFEDLDRDGQQDAGEPGVPGVTVELYMCGMNTVLETATTDANGNYLFDDLEPNKDYYVIFSNLPADYVFSDADQGNDATDSDADMNGETGCYFLDPGENELTVDAGINLPTASLGDLVFEDLDRDGQQDAGEPGVPGVTVELYMCGMNTVLETATTDANGNYLFDDLEPNKDYYVIFSNLPADYVFSDADQGNDATDSDADMNGETGCYFLDPGENELTVDAGINLPTASLGDLVFEDLDRDGQQDAGEPGVPGVTVELYMCGMNTVLETATTDANGNYLFDDLEPNKDYYVIFSNLPTDYVFSDADQGNDATDSDADMNGETGCYFLDPGENELTVDAGINLPTASLGDLVFEDLDRDGQQDAGEPGVPGVTVELYMCGMNTVLETATTDANGNYLFDDLEPNKDYYVIFSNLPTDYVFSDADQGNDATDSDADMNGETGCYFLDPGENELTVDAGINLPTASLGDLVFEDLNENGQQDAGEPGVPGVTVELYMCGMNTVLETATTDANGNYLFDDLEPNKDYYVVFVGTSLPNGFEFTAQDQGSDATDSDADMNGETGCYNLSPGENELSVDAGIKLSFTCVVDAGTLTIDCPSATFCRQYGKATVVAQPDGNVVVPAGYTVAYLFTEIIGSDYVILQVGSSPSFTATYNADYGIHTFVYDGNAGSAEFFDLANIVLGTSTLADVYAMLEVGGGTLCGDLDQTGAVGTVIKCTDPRANDDFVNTLKNMSVTGNLLTNDVNPYGHPLWLKILQSPKNGTFVVDQAGNFTYTPNTGFTGEDSVRYNLRDTTLCNDRNGYGWLYIEVIEPPMANVDDAPVANVDMSMVKEGQAVTIQVMANDLEPDGDQMTIQPMAAPDSGSVVYHPDQTVTYTPDAGIVGEDYFTYLLCDGAGNCDLGRVRVIIAEDNGTGTPPFSSDDAFMIPSGATWNADVRKNDVELDGDVVTYTVVSPPQHGMLLNFNPADGSYTYLPDPGFNGNDEFVYSATDVDGSSSATAKTVVSGGAAIFPVEWLSFDASQEGLNGLLTWKTGSELNASHYQVERSVDAALYETIGEVSATGTTQDVSSYGFTDHRITDLGAERIYYRLRQVDLDGNFSYSRTVELQVDGSQLIGIEVYPTPAREQVYVDWTSTGEPATVTLINGLGQVLTTESIESGTTRAEFNVRELASGVYYIQVSTGKLVGSKSFKVER